MEKRKTNTNIWIWLYLLIVLFFGFLAVRLYLQMNTKGKNKEASYQYIYLAPGGELYWSYIACGVKEADQEGDSYTLLEQYGKSTNLSPCIEGAILSEADGIIMKGTTLDIDGELAAAQEAGIPVVLFDSDVSESLRSCYVGIDNYRIGMQAAELMKRELGEKGKILVITRGKTASSQVDRIRALEEGLQDDAALTIVDYLEDSGDKITLKEELHRILSEHPDINGIVIMEETASDTLPELLELEGMDIRDFYVISMDCTKETMENVRDGKYDVVLMQPMKEIGKQAVSWLNRWQKQKETGQTEDLPETINLDVTVVTKENLEEILGGYDVENLEWNLY